MKIRKVYTPIGNSITFQIPDKYIGTALEINVVPIGEISSVRQRTSPLITTDPSFGGWADMEKSDEDIIGDMKNRMRRNG